MKGADKGLNGNLYWKMGCSVLRFPYSSQEAATQLFSATFYLVHSSTLPQDGHTAIFTSGCTHVFNSICKLQPGQIFFLPSTNIFVAFHDVFKTEIII